jgi:hypothetical protein
MRVTNDIPLGCPLLLPVNTVNCVQTLKVFAGTGLCDAVVCYLSVGWRMVYHNGLAQAYSVVVVVSYLGLDSRDCSVVLFDGC